MRGFGHEAADEQWVEVRPSSSGVRTLVLLNRERNGWEERWEGDPWVAGTTGRPQLDRDAWDAIELIVARAFNQVLGLIDRDGDATPGSKPRTWSVTSATPMRRDLGIVLADLFLAIRRIGPRPAYGYGMGQAAYDAHRDAVASYRAEANREAYDWAMTLLRHPRQEATP